MSIPFLKSLKSIPYFSAADVFYFHLLPDVPYYAGVYEISYSGFASMAGVDRNTAKKFFERLESSGLVSMLRNGKSRGKNTSVAFCRNESALHNFNYSSSSALSLSLPDRNLYYIDSSKANVIPKNFFKSRPNDAIMNQLVYLLNDDTLLTESVFSILENRILTDAKRRYNRVSRVG